MVATVHFPSLFEVNELMDLIQGDLLSADSTPLESVLFSPAEENIAQVDTLSDYVFQNRPRMQRCACSLTRVHCHSIRLSACFCLFLFLSHAHTHTHCKICLWCQAALSLESLHNTLESTHQTLVL